LHHAAWKGNLDELKLLIKKGLNINAKSFQRDTAISRAAINGHVNIVKMFIVTGC